MICRFAKLKFIIYYCMENGFYKYLRYAICPGLLLVWMFYPEGEASRTEIRQGTLEIVIEEVLWSIRESYQTIWSFPLTNVKWHSVTWPYTMTTPYLSDWTEFATDVACRQETLTPPDTWSRPLGLAYVLLVKINPFSELVVTSPDYALRISLGTFSILLTISCYFDTLVSFFHPQNVGHI